MQYICQKQLTVGGVTYYPGKIIPDGVILPERSGKLIRSKHISEPMRYDHSAGLRYAVAELRETEPGAYDGAVPISVESASDGENGQVTVIPAKPGEILQVFSIMQLGAEEGARMIADVTSENVLILLHAADSRKMVKNAAKEQAGKLFSIEGISKAPRGGNGPTGPDMEGGDA